MPLIYLVVTAALFGAAVLSSILSEFLKSGWYRMMFETLMKLFLLAAAITATIGYLFG